MKQKFRLVLFFTLILLFGIEVKSQVIDSSSIDSVVHAHMAEYKIPGLVVGISDSNNLVKLKAYGVADLQNSSPVKDISTFELGSLSKQFTAAAILKLQQNGKLSVEDYLFKYFPESPANWKEIKIKHLLWHTSGLPGMWPHDSFTQNAFTGYSRMSAEELDKMMQTNMVSKEVSIKSIISDSLDFQPGTKYNYSDVGYLVLGLIIDNITGSYQDYMMEEVFKKNEMENTYLINQERVFPNQVRGYSLKDGELINIMRTWDYEIPSFFGIFSNVQDLQKWDATLYSNDFLNEESKNFLFSKGNLNNGNKTNYGGGWNINDVNGLRFISHEGITGTSFIRIPEKGTSVIVLTNLGYNGNDIVKPWDLDNEIAKIIGFETDINKNHITAEGHKVVPLKKRSFKKMEGGYITSDGLEARIYLDTSTPIFSSRNAKHEMALLENGSWLVLGMDYEYILTFDEKKNIVTSNLGRIFNKKD